MLSNASNNMSMLLEWESGARRLQGKMSMLEQGYSQDDILNGFRVEIPSPKTSIGDRLMMGGAALLAILVPLLFVAILLLSTAVWLEFTAELLQAPVNQASMLALGVFLCGDLFLLSFMAALVRRLILIRRGSKSYLEISEEAQPELHAFINHIAHLLNGPKPKSVKLDAEVGLVLRPVCFKDLFKGAGPEVVIGLPLLYGLSARQLSGVIAHAYAGYSRDVRLLGYTILSSMDRWLFTQTGLGRSYAFSSSEFNGKKLSLPDRLLKPFDVLVQGSFYLIYRVISALTFNVSRKVDMVGDMFSARVAGSTEFRSTQFRLRSLHYGQSHANQELINSWRTKKLPDNFPALVVDHADTLQLSLRPRLIQEMEELVTPLTRSRIVDLGRIINVEHTHEEGACFLLGSAISMLREPAEVSRAVTLSQYRHLGIRHPDVYASQKVLSIQKAEREKAKRRQVFCGLENSGRVIRVEDFEGYGLQAEESLQHDYGHLRQKLKNSEATIRHLAETVREYEFRKNLLSTRKVLEECKGNRSKDFRELEVQWLTLIKEQSEFKTQLNAHEANFSRFAGIGLALALKSEAVQEKLEFTQSEMQSHFLRLVDALNFMQRCFESIQRLRGYTQVLGQVLVETDVDTRTEERIAEISVRYQKYMMIELEGLMKVLGGVAYPLGGIGYALAAGKTESDLLTIGDVVHMEVADLDSASSCPEACHRVSNSVCQYLDDFNQQLQQRVAALLSEVEVAHQSESISEPR